MPLKGEVWPPAYLFRPMNAPRRAKTNASRKRVTVVMSYMLSTSNPALTIRPNRERTAAISTKFLLFICLSGGRLLLRIYGLPPLATDAPWCEDKETSCVIHGDGASMPSASWRR